VAAVPGDGIVPLNHSGMRSSSADRERAIDVLKAAFAEGRLDQDEYTTRVGQVYGSRTYGDLAALTADLPAGPLGTLEQPKPPPAQLTPIPPMPPVRRRRQGIPLPFLICLVVVLATAAGHVTVAPAIIVVVLFVMLNIVRWLR
jgi:Domain of unknown function (DUF1707)